MPHQVKYVPVCLQGAGEAQSGTVLVERLVEKIMKDLDGKGFQGCVRILTSVMAVPTGSSKLFEQKTASILIEEVGLTCATAL